VRLDEVALQRWGERVGQTVAPPLVVGLSGPLGAGKSTLARAIGLGAGVVRPMPSPSFNLLFRYPARRGIEVVHMDLYRLEDPEELWELGWQDIGGEREIVLVEWPERAGPLMPPDHWLVHLSIPRNAPRTRDVGVDRVGSPASLSGFPMSVTGP